MRHTLKIEQRWLDAVVDGSKKAELRRADRHFEVGDELLLYTPDFAGGELVVVTHVLHLNEIPGLACPDEYVSLSIERIRHLEGGALAAAVEAEAPGEPI